MPGTVVSLRGGSWRLVAGLAVAVSLAALAVVVARGDATPLDLAVNGAFTPYRTPAALAAFLWITIMGTEAAVLAMALALSVVLWSEGRLRRAAPLWTVVLGAEATTWVLKFLLARPRPDFLPGVATALSPSFPSAHATGTLALVGSLALLAARGSHGRHHRVAITLVAAGVVATIGFSRIYLSVHYLTDVLSGFLVGGLWLLVGSAPAFERWSES